MPRNRIVYQSECLFVGPSPATGFHFMDMSTFGGLGSSSAIYGRVPSAFGNGNTGVNLINQIHRVQEISYDFNIPRTDVLQFGEIGAIDKVNLEPPTVTLNFSYLSAGFHNEKYLGLNLNGGLTGNNPGCLESLINANQSEKNYFIKTVPTSLGDVNNNTTVPYSGEVIAIGNGFITNYTAEGAVGDFPKVSISVEAANMKFDKISCFDKPHPQVDTGTQYIPAVNQVDGTALTTILYSLPKAETSTTTGTNTLVTAFKQGDIRLNLSAYNEGGVDITDAKVQSYSLSIPLSRTAINKLGTKYAYTRELDVPITASLSLNAIVGDLTTGTLTEIINNGRQYNMSILLKPQSVTTAAANEPYPLYFISGAYLESQSYTSSIGPNKSVTLNFSIPIAQKSNIIMTGAYGLGF